LEKERDEFIAQREAEGDLRETIEATLLDKDIADERISELEGQVSDLTTRLEEVELEKDIFKEENGQHTESAVLPFDTLETDSIERPDRSQERTARRTRSRTIVGRIYPAGETERATP